MSKININVRYALSLLFITLTTIVTYFLTDAAVKDIFRVIFGAMFTVSCGGLVVLSILIIRRFLGLNHEKKE